MSQIHLRCYKCDIEMVCEGVSIDPIDGEIFIVYSCPSCKFKVYLITYDNSVQTQEVSK